MSTPVAATPVLPPPPLKAHSSGRRFKAWELLLLLLSLIFTSGSALLYVTGYPIRNIIFGLQSDEIDRPIGKVSNAQGSLRRQLRKGTEFKTLPAEETLYNRDTVVTGPDSGATLEIEDGSVIQLGPSTMVRLVFAEDGALGGISRAPVLEVIQGDVTGKAAAAPLRIKSKTGTREIAKNTQEKITAPKPAPVLKVAKVSLPPMPTVATLPPPAIPVAAPPAAPPVAAAPLPSAEPIKMVRQIASQSELGPSAPTANVPIELAWTGGASKEPVRVVITKNGNTTPLVDEKIDTPEDPKAGERTWKGSLNLAGGFQWRLLKEDDSAYTDAKGKPVGGSFMVKPEWKKIAPLKALVGGRESDTNDFEGGDLKRSPAITFRWKSSLARGAIPAGTLARVQIWDTASPEKPIFDQRVQGEKVEFSKDRLYLGKLIWNVSIPLAGGFVATTGPQEFQVKFNPPTMVVPEDGAKILRSEINKSSDGSVILTWKKTLFTERYEVEVSDDPAFGKVIWKARVSENYALFKTAKNQVFYWRVRSTNSTGASGFSLVRKFTLQQ